MSAEILTRREFDTGVREQLAADDAAADYDQWWCVETDPFPCPAAGCDFVAYFMTGAHLIIVWPSADDMEMLRRADEAKRFGRNPRVVRYEQEFGPCVAYDRWTRMGSPAHGLYARPDGYHRARF